MKVVLKELTKIFPSRDKKDKTEVVAVDNFNIEIPDDKLVGLLGPSGCGKSTALNLICGLEKPTKGQIFFGDDDVTELPPEERGVGMVFQNYALFPHMTVEQNIMFPLGNLKGEKKLTKEEMKAKALESAKLVQIENLMARKPKEMSGGQQQRVAIARALVKRPKILLLDEPLSNLDARLRLQTREEIRRIQRETGITTIFVTHDQEEAMSISDLIVVMKSGVIHQVGRPQEVYDKPVDLFVAKFLGTPAINVFKGIIRNGGLYIDDSKVLDVPDKAMVGGIERATDGMEVFVGIRPEGFILDENGPLTCRLDRVEVMGRDISVVSYNDAATDAGTVCVRSIISAENDVDESKSDIRFSLKPAKVHIFETDSENVLVY
jgi:multiple sugar transport system ATP-binding protein